MNFSGLMMKICSKPDLDLPRSGKENKMRVIVESYRNEGEKANIAFE